MNPANLILGLIAAGIGWAAGPRIAWAIRSWPGHEEMKPDYLRCHDCPGGIKRRCYNAGRRQDIFYTIFSAVVAGISVGYWGIGTKAVISWIFSISCLIISVVDIRYLIIPDTLSINGCFVGLGYALSCFIWVKLGFAEPQHYISITNSVLGFLLGGGFLWALGWIVFKLLKKEGMGGGDVKLLAAMGSWTGWQYVLGTIVLASFLGATGGITGIIYQRIRYKKSYKPLTHMIPFGPYLCIAFLFIFYFGLEPLKALLNHYQMWLDSNFQPIN